MKQYLYSGGKYLEVSDITVNEKDLHKGNTINEIIKTQQCRDFFSAVVWDNSIITTTKMKPIVSAY